MARPPRVDIAGGLYHVAARGNERKAIFRDDYDRERYLIRLAECRTRLGFFLYAYCLMTNHVHLVIERGPIPLSRIMLNLHSFHGQKFNRRHDRVGHLFQGRYKAFLVDRDRYLFSLLRYVHLNPVKAKIVRDPARFRWSSDRFYRAGLGPAWLDLDRGLSMLAPRRSAAVARYRGLFASVSGSEYEDARPVAAVIKGDEEFAGRVLRAAGLARWKRWSVEEVADAVAFAENVRVDDLRGRRQNAGLSRKRAIAAYLARHEAGISIAEMARYLHRDESTLIKGIRGLELALESNSDLMGRLQRATGRLSAGRISGFQG